MKPEKSVLIIDNFDSFTFNIAQLVGEINGTDPIVLNNTVPWREIRKIPHDRIIISPGPGNPQTSQDIGSSMDVLGRSSSPILGVCLGHQCIAINNGMNVIKADEPMHGRIQEVRHLDNDPLFNKIPTNFLVTRYHSLVAVPPIPNTIKVIANLNDGTIMGIRHRSKPHWGVQFHPESICSEHGSDLIANFLNDKLLKLPNLNFDRRDELT